MYVRIDVTNSGVAGVHSTLTMKSAIWRLLVNQGINLINDLLDRGVSLGSVLDPLLDCTVDLKLFQHDDYPYT